MKLLNQLIEETAENRNAFFRNIFSARLKEIREEQKLWQKDVADKLGCAVSTYANWEQGRTEPSICDIYNLMVAFGVDANELFNIDNIK